MAGILGVGTDLPIKSIIDTLVAAEKEPKANQLDNLEKQTTARLSSLGSLKNALSTFKTAVDGLNKASLFEGRTASSSNSGVVKVTASSTAPAGSYDIQVRQLATSSKVALQSVDGGNAATFNSGSMSISAGSTSINVQVNSSNNTLAGMRDAINEAGKNSGISATILTDVSGSRLILSSTKSGDGNDVKVAIEEDGLVSGDNALTTQKFEAEEDPSGGFSPPNSASGAGGVITTAKSALLSIDGLQMARETNTIADAIEGVTLDLTSIQSATDLADGKTISVAVGIDKSGVKSSITKFVEAYNALIKTTSELTAVVSLGEDKKPVTGGLVGDSTIRNVIAGVRNEMVAMTGEGGIKALANLGITTNFTPSGKSTAGSAINGTLSIDDDKLSKALNDNFDEIAGYLTGDKGLMGRLSQSVDGYIKSDGVIQQREVGLQGTHKNIDEQRVALNLRIENMHARLVKQYTALDTMVAGLNRTSQSLASTLANLPGVVKKSK